MTGSPSAFVGAVPKTTVIVARVTNIPTEPISSSGLRPTRSINAIAMNVATMLTVELITPVSRASSSLKPTACHRVEE